MIKNKIVNNFRGLARSIFSLITCVEGTYAEELPEKTLKTTFIKVQSVTTIENGVKLRYDTTISPFQ